MTCGLPAGRRTPMFNPNIRSEGMAVGSDKICGMKVDGDVCFVDYEQTEDTSADNSTAKLKVGDILSPVLDKRS